MRWRLWVLAGLRGAVAALLAVVSLLTELCRAHPRLVAVKLGLGGVLVSLAGCGEAEDTGRKRPSDTCYVPAETCYDITWWPEPAEIDTITYVHHDDSWRYIVELLGWGTVANLEIHADDGVVVWEELHGMVNTEWADDGSWDRWELDLAVVSDPAKQEGGVTTLYAANDKTEATMTWRVVVYTDAEIADCAVWGLDPTVFDDLDCRTIEAD